MGFKNILYRIVRYVPCFFRSNQLLIVRLDAIGDYILFRNGIEALKKSERFSKYKYTLLGNKLWKDLAESLDSEYIDRFIWIDPTILYNRNEFNFTRLKLLFQLKFPGFKIVIHPVHSRLLGVDLFIDDLNIPVAIGSSGDDTNYEANQKTIADKVYGELIPVPGNGTFEFVRTQYFFSMLTAPVVPEIELTIKNTESKPSEPIIAIAPGAGHEQRRWPPERFAEVIKTIESKNANASFYICGAASDMDAARIILKNTLGCRVENFCGTQSLSKFVKLMKKCTMLIANESGAVHIAAALNVPAICISNGNMFGRFNPYPESLKKPVHTLYPDPGFYDPDKFEHLIEKTRIRSDFDITLITSSSVSEKCFHILESAETSV